TSLLADIAPGAGDSYPLVIGRTDTAIFLAANDGSPGSELWKSDPNGGAIQLVRDLTPGPASSYPADLIDVGGTLFFRATPQLHGGQLWRTDGTEAGTVMLKSFAGFFQTALLAAVGDRLVFTSDDDAHGDELWGSDGTAEGTVLLADIVPGPGDSSPDEFTAMDGSLFFQARGGLWRTDGTAAGTQLVARGSDFENDYCRSPFQLVVVGDTLYFRTCLAGGGTDLWKSDGTAAGTVRLRQITIGPVIDRTYALL